MRHFRLIPLFFLLALVTPSQAQTTPDPFDPLGKQSLDSLVKLIRIQLEWIEVNQETLTDLMSKDRRLGVTGLLSSNDQSLRDEITELIKKKEAKIVEVTSTIARSGNRAKTESAREFAYPTEFDPPTVKGEILVPPTPAAFETRSVGSILEVDTQLGMDSINIDINLSAELVHKVGFETYGSYQTDAAATDIKQPTFYIAKITTQICMCNGEPLMVGILTHHHVKTGEPEPTRKLMLFARADVLYVGLPTGK